MDKTKKNHLDSNVPIASLCWLQRSFGTNIFGKKSHKKQYHKGDKQPQQVQEDKYIG